MDKNSHNQVYTRERKQCREIIRKGGIGKWKTSWKNIATFRAREVFVKTFSKVMAIDGERKAIKVKEKGTNSAAIKE